MWGYQGRTEGVEKLSKGGESSLLFLLPYIHPPPPPPPAPPPSTALALSDMVMLIADTGERGVSAPACLGTSRRPSGDKNSALNHSLQCSSVRVCVCVDGCTVNELEIRPRGSGSAGRGRMAPNKGEEGAEAHTCTLPYSINSEA